LEDTDDDNDVAADAEAGVHGIFNGKANRGVCTAFHRLLNLTMWLIYELVSFLSVYLQARNKSQKSAAD
jgi:hypothetical protein